MKSYSSTFTTASLCTFVICNNKKKNYYFIITQLCQQTAKYIALCLNRMSYHSVLYKCSIELQVKLLPGGIILQHYIAALNIKTHARRHLCPERILQISSLMAWLNIDFVCNTITSVNWVNILVARCAKRTHASPAVRFAANTCVTIVTRYASFTPVAFCIVLTVLQ